MTDRKPRSRELATPEQLRDLEFMETELQSLTKASLAKLWREAGYKKRPQEISLAAFRAFDGLYRLNTQALAKPKLPEWLTRKMLLRLVSWLIEEENHDAAQSVITEMSKWENTQ